MSDKEKYKNELLNLFPYKSKKEKEFIDSFMNNMEDNSYEDIIKECGTPISVIYAYLENQNTEVLLKKLYIRKTIKRFLICTLIILLFLLIMYIYFLNKAFDITNDQKVNEIKETLIIE